MARKRLHPTSESLIESVGHLGLSLRSVDVEALRAHLERPEFGATVDDERIGRGLRAGMVIGEVAACAPVLATLPTPDASADAPD